MCFFGFIYKRKIVKMAKAKGAAGSDNKKISFGKKKLGKYKKSFNKHESKKRYRGQGR